MMKQASVTRHIHRSLTLAAVVAALAVPGLAEALLIANQPLGPEYRSQLAS